MATSQVTKTTPAQRHDVAGPRFAVNDTVIYVGGTKWDDETQKWVPDTDTGTVVYRARSFDSPEWQYLVQWDMGQEPTICENLDWYDGTRLTKVAPADVENSNAN